MVSDRELFDKKALQQESQAFQRLLSNNGLNGLVLPPADSPASPALSSVGRRTSVLFKKAKNGVKLQRGLECSLENGEEHRQGGQRSPSCPDGERQARKRPQSRSCSDSNGEKSPRQAGQRGEERVGCDSAMVLGPRLYSMISEVFSNCFCDSVISWDFFSFWKLWRGKSWGFVKTSVSKLHTWK